MRTSVEVAQFTPDTEEEHYFYFIFFLQQNYFHIKAVLVKEMKK